MSVSSTENLALAAFALAEGAVLRSISVSAANGRRTGVFTVEAANLDHLFAAFYNCTATVNVASFRRQLDELRDRLSAALHPTQTHDHARRTHDPHRQGGASAPQGTR